MTHEIPKERRYYICRKTRFDLYKEVLRVITMIKGVLYCIECIPKETK